MPLSDLTRALIEGTKYNKWVPTGGRDSLLDQRMRQGTFNGQPIFVHFSNAAGYAGITATRQIRRSANGNVYLVNAKSCFAKSETLSNIFIGSGTHVGKGDYCFVFAFCVVPSERDATIRSNMVTSASVSGSSGPTENTYRDDIHFAQIDLLYQGPNMFVEERHQQRSASSGHGPLLTREDRLERTRQERLAQAHSSAIGPSSVR